MYKLLVRSEIYSLYTTNEIVKTFETHLTKKNYTEARILAEILKQRNANLPFDYIKLIAVLEELNKTMSDNNFSKEIYEKIESTIYRINNAIKLTDISKAENEINHLKSYALELIQHKGIEKEEKNIKLILESIIMSTCSNENTNEQIACNLIIILMEKNYQSAIALAKKIDKENNFPFNLEKLIILYEKLDIKLTNNNLNTLNEEIKVKIRNIIIAIAKSQNNLTDLVNELEDYLIDPNKINLSAPYVSPYNIQNLFMKIINATDYYENKKTNTFLCKFLLNALHNKRYSDAIIFANKLNINNNLPFKMNQLIYTLQELTRISAKYNTDQDFKIALNKLHENIEKHIENIILAIENSEDIQSKIDELKNFAENFNNKDYPIQNKNQKLINTVIVNVLIAIGCLGVGFPLALGLHYWKTGSVFFKEHTKREKKFNAQADKATKMISSTLASKK
jgi:hypothetical protein